ncbi:MAG: putative Ig domain-containing protein [Dermatophilaceae bacterium]
MAAKIYPGYVREIPSVQPVQLPTPPGAATLLVQNQSAYSVDLAPTSDFVASQTFTLQANEPINWPVSGPLWARVTPGQAGAPTSVNIWVQPNGIAAPPHNLQNALTVTTTSLAAATVSVAYAATLTASGGSPPYSWSVTSGSLPAGLSLASDGSITGTPTTAGPTTFVVEVKDAAGSTVSQPLSLTVGAAPLASVTGLVPVAIGVTQLPTTTSVSASVSLANVVSGQPIVLIGIVSVLGDYPSLNPVDDFSTPYNWTIRQQPTATGMTLLLATGEGGAGTSGTITVTYPTAGRIGLLAMSPVNAASPSGAYVTSAGTDSAGTQPSVAPSVTNGSKTSLGIAAFASLVDSSGEFLEWIDSAPAGSYIIPLPDTTNAAANTQIATILIVTPGLGASQSYAPELYFTPTSGSVLSLTTLLQHA